MNPCRPAADSSRYSRLRMRRLVSLEGVGQVVLVVHVALRAQVVVETHFTLPPHSHDPVLLTAVTDDVGVTDTLENRNQQINLRKSLCLLPNF